MESTKNTCLEESPGKHVTLVKGDFYTRAQEPYVKLFVNDCVLSLFTFHTPIFGIRVLHYYFQEKKIIGCSRNWTLILTRAGYHQVPRDTIPSRYFAHDSDNITIQRFCNNRYIARNFIHDTSRYLCHWRNPEFTDCTESISQELQDISHEWKPSKQRVYCTVSLNTHTDYNYH